MFVVNWFIGKHIILLKEYNCCSVWCVIKNCFRTIPYYNIEEKCLLLYLVTNNQNILTNKIYVWDHSDYHSCKLIFAVLYSVFVNFFVFITPLYYINRHLVSLLFYNTHFITYLICSLSTVFETLIDDRLMEGNG